MAVHPKQSEGFRIKRLIWSNTINADPRVAYSSEDKNWNEKQENKRKPDKNCERINSTNYYFSLENVICERNGEEKLTKNFMSNILGHGLMLKSSLPCKTSSNISSSESVDEENRKVDYSQSNRGEIILQSYNMFYLTCPKWRDPTKKNVYIHCYGVDRLRGIGAEGGGRWRKWKLDGFFSCNFRTVSMKILSR
ncbi:hypothetical protein Ccrd_021699 [Cynara cardunculus var. scolymus]|uniref:Uncharacterized protein n=1 Tax=Cynara cardunculus var. scolymus TaxID=59895 RepID=A0A103Y025_CYNCS|nr:hypothetical protein Ccrd_021699 [Cynara cardunculus var. scolymus]